MTKFTNRKEIRYVCGNRLGFHIFIISACSRNVKYILTKIRSCARQLFARCRGGDSRARRRTPDPYRLSLKWHAPIATSPTERSSSNNQKQFPARRHPRRAGVCSGTPCAPWAVTSFRIPSPTAPAPRFVIARRPQADVAISGRQLRFRRRLPHDPTVYCEIATSLRSSQ